MAGRVGQITHMYGKADAHGNVVLDGTCRVHNDITGQDWFGRLVLLSGGNVVFSLTDDRGAPVQAGSEESGQSFTSHDESPAFSERPQRASRSSRSKEKSSS